MHVQPVVAVLRPQSHTVYDIIAFCGLRQHRLGLPSHACCFRSCDDWVHSTAPRARHLSAYVRISPAPARLCTCPPPHPLLIALVRRGHPVRASPDRYSEGAMRRHASASANEGQGACCTHHESAALKLRLSVFAARGGSGGAAP